MEPLVPALLACRFVPFPRSIAPCHRCHTLSERDIIFVGFWGASSLITFITVSFGPMLYADKGPVLWSIKAPCGSKWSNGLQFIFVVLSVVKPRGLGVYTCHNSSFDCYSQF